MTVRVAAVGDVHFNRSSEGRLRPHLDALDADVFLIAGDLTCFGTVEEAQVLADELRDSAVPTFAVLGNHDHHSDQQLGIAAVMADAGVRVLEGEAAEIEVRGETVGVAGAKGFGGGFAGACASEFGEAETKAFVGHTRAIASRLRDVLSGLSTDVRIALLHYSPIQETLEGERLEIYPFLGSYLLGEAIDEAGADLVFHGHAHAGQEEGKTAGGIPVRNVASHVITAPIALYEVSERSATRCL